MKKRKLEDDKGEDTERKMCMCVCARAVLVVSNSLQLHGLQAANSSVRGTF